MPACKQGIFERGNLNLLRATTPGFLLTFMSDLNYDILASPALAPSPRRNNSDSRLAS